MENSSCFYHNVEIETYENFSMLIPNSRIFRAMVVEKMVCESERKVS